MPDITASNTPTFSTSSPAFDHLTAAFAQIWNTDKQKFLDNDMFLKKAIEAIDARVTALENAEPPADTTGPGSVNAVYSSTNFTEDGTLTITVTATDPSGIDRVEFYKNASLVATDSTTPYVYSESITSADNGNHTYHVKVFDNLENSTTSSNQAVTVNIVDIVTGPDVNFSVDDTTPSGGAQWVMLVADVTPNPYEVDYVEFYNNGTLIGTIQNAPYRYPKSFFYPASGIDVFKVRAYDIHGNYTESPTINTTFTSTNPDESPTVDITINGGMVESVSEGPITLSATFSSDVGVTDLYISYSRNYGPWTQWSHAEYVSPNTGATVPDSYNPGVNGIYRFRATAVDSAGRITHSDGTLPPSSYANTVIVLIPDQSGEVQFQGTSLASSTVTPSELYEPVALIGQITVPAGKKLYMTGDHFFKYNPESDNLGPAQVTLAYMNYDPAGDMVLAQVTVLNHNTSADTTSTASGSSDLLIYHNTGGSEQSMELYVNLKNPQGVGGTTIQGEVTYDFGIKLTS